MRSVAILKYAGSFSMPIKFLFRFLQATPVVLEVVVMDSLNPSKKLFFAHRVLGEVTELTAGDGVFLCVTNGDV